MHHSTCVTHVSWCMSGSLAPGPGENVPDIPGTCATRNYTYLAKGQCKSRRMCAGGNASELFPSLIECKLPLVQLEMYWYVFLVVTSGKKIYKTMSVMKYALTLAAFTARSWSNITCYYVINDLRIVCSTGDRWIPLTKDQQRRKKFHLMTPSWRQTAWCFDMK